MGAVSAGECTGQVTAGGFGPPDDVQCLDGYRGHRSARGVRVGQPGADVEDRRRVVAVITVAGRAGLDAGLARVEQAFAADRGRLGPVRCRQLEDLLALLVPDPAVGEVERTSDGCGPVAADEVSGAGGRSVLWQITRMRRQLLIGASALSAL